MRHKRDANQTWCFCSLNQLSHALRLFFVHTKYVCPHCVDRYRWSISTGFIDVDNVPRIDSKKLYNRLLANLNTIYQVHFQCHDSRYISQLFKNQGGTFNDTVC